jgi:hypothetical protein
MKAIGLLTEPLDVLVSSFKTERARKWEFLTSPKGKIGWSTVWQCAEDEHSMLEKMIIISYYNTYTVAQGIFLIIFLRHA